MPENIKKTNVVTRALHGTDKIFNKIITFICGIFHSAIFFLLMMKLLNNWGIYLGLSASICLNVWLKKKYKKVPFLNMLNNGIIAFNVFTALVLLFFVVTIFGVFQQALK